MSRVVKSVGLISVIWVAYCCASTTAFALSEGRVYELVSPVFKGGYGVTTLHAAASNGESVAFVSSGGFGGVLSASGQATNEYVARRSPSGWLTASLQPPFGSWIDVSGNLEYALANDPVGANAGVENYSGTEDEFLLHRTDAPEIAENWEVVGGMILKRLDKRPLIGIEEGASPDFCHVVVGRTEGPLLPGATNTNNQLYDLERGCAGEPSLGIVGLNNMGTVINPKCGVELGIGQEYAGSGLNKETEDNFNAVAADGKEMFFTTKVNVEEGGHCDLGSHQLFVRLGGTKTLEISKPITECTQAPIEVPCAGAGGRGSASFKGASEDGSRVFFTTTQSLVSKDQDQSNDLYMATIGCADSNAPECGPEKQEVTSLVQISHQPTIGQAAEVRGVTKVAPDGSHIYFVARGILSDGPNSEGHTPVKGAENLYVYDSATNKLAFIADLCSRAALSGTVEDSHCPGNLSGGESQINDLGLLGSFPEAQTAGQDGRFLVFSTYAQLSPSDTDNAKDVYRYDAETGALARVSLGEEGYDSNGNDSAFDATIVPGHAGGSAKIYLQYEMGTHAVSEDGKRIVFTTAGPLSPDAINGLPNVYEWHEGSVSLISSGSAEEADADAVISPSGLPPGRDVFFTTSQGLVSQDTDGARDIYDARIEGGFAPAPAQRQPCSGDACQGGLSAPAPLLVPGSVSQASGENFAPPKKKAPPPKKKKKKIKKKKPSIKRAKKAHQSSVTTTRGRGL
jgi:hypothetical protein